MQNLTEQFEQDGFLVQDNLFTPAEIHSLRDAAESSIVMDAEACERQQAGTIHLLGLAAKHPLFVQLARDQRIVGILRDLLGNDIQLQHSKLAAQARQGGKGGFGWHQDFAFFPHTNTSLVAVMVMLDDATPENGCMSMVRGSHHWGQLDHANTEGYFVGACQERERWENHPELIVPVTPKAGGISIHHCLILHGSGPNPSGLPRRGLVFQYRADDAYQLCDTVFEDTGLLVSGARRGLVRCDPATFTLARRRTADGINYGSAWNQIGPFAARA